MAAPHQALLAARRKERPQAIHHDAAFAAERRCLRGVEQFRARPERRLVPVDIGCERRDPGCRLDHRNAPVARRHGAREPVRERKVDGAGVRKVVEGLGFVETPHFHGPFDACAAARECQGAIALPRNANHAKVERGCESAIDLELRLASRTPLRQRREIEKRIANRALDLEGAITGQKHRRRMGIDAPHRRTPMGRRIGQEGEYLGLAAISASVAFAISVRGHRVACLCLRAAPIAMPCGDIPP